MVTVHDNVVVRTHAHIVGLVEEARLPDRVARRALATFAALAEVEARLHRRPVDQVHFHEVGGHDTIIDVVGTAAALEVLGIDEVRASPVATGLGMVRAAHGLLPNPAPAVVAPARGRPHLGTRRARRADHAHRGGAAGCAGVRDSAHAADAGDGPGIRRRQPRARRAPQLHPGRDRHPGGCRGCATGGGRRPTGAVLEANLDDATGEQLAHAVAPLLDAGAHDAWLTPAVMKKGRPGHVVHVLCDPVGVRVLRAVLRAETGSAGVRMTTAERWPAARTVDTVVVDGEPVRVKATAVRAKAEHDDVVAVAAPDRPAAP